MGSLSGSAGSNDASSLEISADVTEHAQNVVDQIQIAELNEVVNLMSQEYYKHDMPGHYVLIDKLDENWVDEKIRYKLIKALIENARDFSRVSGFKVIISLRGKRPVAPCSPMKSARI
jgi:hypothetical protein